MNRTVLCLVCCCAAVFAEHYDAPVFGALEWRSIGPPRGGRSITSAGSPARPLRILLRRHRRRTMEDHRRRATGARSPTARSRAPRWARWRCRNPTPMWSTSAWARPSCAAISCRATASTNRPTPARRGSMWDWPDTQAISRIRIDPANPDIVYVAALRPPLRPERGARRFPVHRTAARPGRRFSIRDDHSGAVDLCHGPTQSNVSVRGHLGCLSHAVDAVQRRTRQRPLQDPPTAAITGPRSLAIPGCPRASSARSGWRFRAPTPTVSTRWWRTKMAACSLRRRGRDLEARQRRPAAAAARLLLHADLLPTPRSRTRVYVLNTGLLSLHGRRQDGQGSCIRRTATTTISGSTPQSAAHDRVQRRRRQRSRSNGGESLDRPGRIRPRSSITWPPRETFPITSAARSRTTPPSASRARPADRGSDAAATRAPLLGGRRRKRLHRAASHESRTSFTRAARARCSRASTGATGSTRDIQVYPMFFSGECPRAR